MQSERPVHRFDLGRFDKARMCDRDRMQDTFERFLPEFQKALQLGKFGAEIVGLPDIGLQQPDQGADIGFVPWSDRARRRLLKILRDHANPQSLLIQVFRSASDMGLWRRLVMFRRLIVCVFHIMLAGKFRQPTETTSIMAE